MIKRVSKIKVPDMDPAGLALIPNVDNYAVVGSASFGKDDSHLFSDAPERENGKQEFNILKESLLNPAKNEIRMTRALATSALPFTSCDKSGYSAQYRYDDGTGVVLNGYDENGPGHAPLRESGRLRFPRRP